MPSHLRKIDHVTCVVHPQTIKQWAWFYIDILGGVLTLRTDDTNPSGSSSMMVWTIDFADFGIALIAGIDRQEKSHVTAFYEKHGDHSFQHVAFQVPNLDGLCSRLASYGVNLLGDTLARKDATGRYIKQVFGSPFHDEENSSVVGFYEFVERPAPEADPERKRSVAPEVSFSEKAGGLLYEQAQTEMLEDRRARMTRFSKMPPTWELPEPAPERAGQGAVEVVKRRGRREHDSEVIGDIQRWQSYRSANTRFPDARAAELGEMSRLANVQPGETIAEVGAGQGALTYRLANAVGTQGRVFTYDISRDNLISVMLSNDKGLPIIPVAQSLADDAIRFPNESEVDCVATLATFHHFDNRSVKRWTRGREAAIAAFYRLLRRGGRLVIGDVAGGTGPQRYFDAIDNPRYCHPNGHPHDFLTVTEMTQLVRAAIAAFYRLLRRGGRLVIGDVAGGTGPQRYFDAIDNPRYCHPNGHPHDFLTVTEMTQLVRAAGFTDVTCSVRSVPWVFASKADAVDFMGAMHNAQCPLEEVAALAEEHLRFDEVSGKCSLQWELLFLEARKG